MSCALMPRFEPDLGNTSLILSGTPYLIAASKNTVSPLPDVMQSFVSINWKGRIVLLYTWLKRPFQLFLSRLQGTNLLLTTTYSCDIYKQILKFMGVLSLYIYGK